LKIEIYIFFSICFLWNYLDLMTWVWRVNAGWFEYFFSHLYFIFYQFNHLMLVLLGIGLHKFYLFILYIVIMVLWSELRVWLFDLKIFVIFLILSFWYWIEWKLRFIFYFGLHFTRLFWSHDSNPKFSWLIYVFFVLIFYLRFFHFII